ncbi:MAG: DNA replication/repair protein RecF [Firmicutes bacterium]|nr:DNA replication/repair protein RecF [Bacillota bacterium]
MYIKKIELYNFRNYKEEKISFNEKVNLFLGNNAQGKTNLLEGIYLNAFGKSFKNVKDKELIRFGEEFCRIKTTIHKNDEDEVVEIFINQDGKKGIKREGVKLKKASELLEEYYMIVFSPEDMKIVKEEPEKRRRFINRELCQIRKGYLNDFNNYRKILKQRNAYLKELYIEDAVLDVWDLELAEYGSRIIQKRKEFIEMLGPVCSNINESITGGKESLDIKYESSINEEGNIKETFYDILQQNRSSDKRNRTTGKGPHKDDLKISSNGIDLRKFGSQGQQRTAALSLKLSEIEIIEKETGEKPVLLLDDVLSELDNERQMYLINSLGENQLFVTTTDIVDAVAEKLPKGKIFKINNGKVSFNS